MTAAQTLSAEIIAQIKHLEIRSRRLATDALSGAYASSFHGRGMEFQEVREYVPGDDVRAIDWNVTARTNVPHIKVYREERELTILLAVDISPSVFGSGLGRTPIDAARELAGVIAWLSMRNNDRVGLLLFSNKVEYFLPPKKGKGHVWRIIRDLFAHKPDGSTTDISVPVDFIQTVLKRRASVFFVSDFWADSFQEPLRRLAMKHDLTCVSLRDDAMANLPKAGIVRWRDRETKQELMLDTSDPIVRGSFEASLANRGRASSKFCRDIGADHFEISSYTSVVEPLSRFLLGHHAEVHKTQAWNEGGKAK